MAHHGENPFSNLDAADLKKMFEKDENPLGATGKFPDGKLTDSDEGEIMVGITSVEGRVIINFGKPVHWVGFTREQAMGIANSITKHAATIPVTNKSE